MSEEAAFLAALKVNPADDITRLVYADWLDEHGEAAKAAYLKLVAGVVPFLGATDTETTVERVATLASTLSPTWRLAAGCRFGLLFEAFHPGYKLDIIKYVLELTRSGVEKSKLLVESTPQILPLCATLEGVAGVKVSQVGWDVRLLPYTPSGDVSRTVGSISVSAFIAYGNYDGPIESAEIAFRSLLTTALGITDAQADELVRARHDIELANGLSYLELRDRLPHWRSLVPPRNHSRWWEIVLQSSCVLAPADHS